ncbi:hypothetical protein [Miltoncostaea oceani]|uniref:hypothetical protein n=1 Tax=Miltoncostaea oceani TaxID=2843216 RepID=UPI001C3C8ADE|nr:hypothetical protein [Miltoncostaea oceani]
MSDHHWIDRLLRVAAIATLSTIALLYWQTQERVSRIEGPVCAQLRDLTDRNVRGMRYELTRIDSALAQAAAGTLTLPAGRAAELRDQRAVIEDSVADTKEPPC